MAEVIDHPFGSKVKETNAPAPTGWRIPDTAQWRRADEGVGSDLWSLLSSPVARRRSVAREFASALSAKGDVVEVWITDLENDLSMAVALQGAATEIEIRTTFLNLVMERLDPQEGDLQVFPSGCVPDWAKRGEQLV